ncbi:hypothetical protein DSLASN_39400 [Desulfoluna limicola]|uniref:Histidine kinase n=1 Tax=Desulfoluna limicola TaxID=2810562 RepID=A0ABM7PL85_9BACT|nr:PAS domain S-box protein [Desulfoluna limicola]BCS98308.1 hypothetical protein DSLASN_39400 [Desulfoluna limicola]
MKPLATARKALERHWATVPAEMQPGFRRHVRLTNARRLNVIFAATVAGTTTLSSFRAIIARGPDVPTHHAHFLTMGAIIVATTLILLLIHHRIDPEKTAGPHRLLLGSTILILGAAFSVVAGIEYAAVGGITRFYLTIFGLCTALILTPATLILSFTWATVCLLTTVWIMEATLTPFLLENMHLMGLLLLGGVISRTVATTFIRDYLLFQEVDHSNRELRREIHEREKVMRRLARSEREFKNAFEYAPDAYILSDPSGKVARLNRATLDLIGNTHEEAKEKLPHEVSFLWGNNLLQVERMLQETLICGRSGPCELQKITLHEGRAIHLELHASMVHIEDREMILTIARDITKRKEGEALLRESRKRLEERVKERTEELEHINIRLKDEITERIATEAALAKTENHYRLLVENMNEGLAIFDTEGRFTYMNDCLCAMTGYNRETLMGRDHTFVVAREDHPLVQTQQGKRPEGGGAAYEARLATASGEILHIQISPKPMFDDKGNYRGSFVVITNITGLKKMETALRKSEERARALLNSSGDAAMLATPSGILLEVNEISCTLLQTPRAELVGRSILDGFPKTIPSRQVATFRQALKTGTIARFEDQMIGGQNFYDITIHPIAHQGRVDRVAIFARNITELKAAEKHIRTLSQELIKAQENERQRIARDLHDNVAQDLATLKIGWDTLLDTLSDTNPGVQEKTRALSRLLRGSIESIRGLAYNLQPPELEQLGLITAIRRYCEEQATYSGLAIDLFTAGVKELTLSFDTQINLYRLVQEALSNVRKHAEADRVAIRLTASHPNLILTVEDNGQGFHVQERLTEAVNEKRMGVRSMEERVSLLHGSMRLTSSMGTGTRLRIEVPAEREHPGCNVA